MMQYSPSEKSTKVRERSIGAPLLFILRISARGSREKDGRKRCSVMPGANFIASFPGKQKNYEIAEIMDLFSFQTSEKN